MSRDSGAGGLRAITAVIALYALVLQVFLGTLMPLPSLGHVGPLCSSLTDGTDTDQSPVKSGHGKHDFCCTSASAVAVATVIGLVSSQTVWPLSAGIRLTWLSEARPGGRGPPGTIPQPRGPPIV